ncbi:bromodomain-containing protein [Mycena maculata]|uniref:Bromodomain-containing protein n=1 Tax=Mycena maculata TaxID=230809 RepID=A0AAD7IMQ8_9AGAR|nr:bromodomain-containing protein [Mycena maculata]
MARGQVTPAVTAPALPKPSFTKIEDEPGFPAFSDQIRSFGYHNPTDFELPSQYIRHIEPLEIDLERQVEYDMDEQDQEWLDAVNAERTKAGNGSVSYEIFEVIIDRLEKEWFNLNKHIPKPDLALPSEDSTCAICDDSEGENSNAIVFCDGCNLAVHQGADCYGVPYIPEGQWLCRKCTVSPENPVSCILCPNEGGAFKQTSQGEWIHLLCAIWIPETRVSNDVFMEPIIGVEKITKGRWKLKCTICLNREGACIQCANKSCFLAFHVTCARKDRLLLPMKSAQGSEPGALTCYCDRHLPKEQAEIREAAMKAEEEEGEDLECKSAQLSKSARAYAKTYKPGPPLVPAIILGRIVQYISRVLIHKKPDFVALVCRYWSLKREARRGAPLLKRLHLEPWTASSSTKTQGEEEKVMKLEQLRRLRKDLEDLEHLTELSRQREARKLHQAEVIHEVLSKAIFPAVPELRKAFKAITTVDRNEYFKNPVSKKDVPDYFDIVKRPMFWSKIEENLDNYQYWDIQSFKDDIQLVLDNAVLYNKQGTTFHKAALRIQASAQPILAGLDQLSSSPNLRLAEQADGTTLPWTVAPVGDLEPSLEILELLFSSDALKDESEHILSADPLTSLFNFELGKKRPTPPPPTPLSKPPLQKQQTRAARAARGSSVQDSFKEQTASAPPEPRAPRTRNAVAAAVAFEAEPGSSSVSAPPRRSRASKASAPVSEAPSPQPRRPSAPIPSLGEIPLVESVDDRDSFTMFDQGWILPQGQRRGGRVAQERSAAPPPKKKQRVGDARGTSRLSTFSTAASENQTLHPGSPYGDGIGGASSSMDNSIEIDPGERPRSTRNVARKSGDSVPPRLHSRPVLTPERVVIPPPNVIRTPDGKVIIEELDTPSIRKEKRRLEMEKRAAAAADAASLSMEGSLSPLPDSPDTNQDEDADDEDADMTSDLSEVESDEDAPGGNDEAEETHHELAGEQDSPSAPLRATQPVKSIDPITLHSSDATVVSYPWWPAVIFGDNDNMIPIKVLAEAQSQRKRQKGKDWLYIVRFFDKNKSWQYLPLEKMRELGESPELDQDMLSKNSKRQNWKNKSSAHTDCQIAYK